MHGYKPTINSLTQSWHAERLAENDSSTASYGHTTRMLQVRSPHGSCRLSQLAQSVSSLCHQTALARPTCRLRDFRHLANAYKIGFAAASATSGVDADKLILLSTWSFPAF